MTELAPDVLAPLLQRYCIGLTGGIATGKSTVAHLLTRRGEIVFDADVLARRATAPGSRGATAILDAFGTRAPDGGLDRRALRRVVFGDAAARARLESLVHPLIRVELARAVKQAGIAATPRLFFYEASLLLERGREGEFRRIWATLCPLAMQRARLMSRDGVTAAEADATLAAQWSAERKAQAAHLVLDTSVSLGALEMQVVTALHQERAKLAQEGSS